MTLPPRWPHQTRGFEGTLAAIEEGHNRICLTSPTGGGKTRMVRDLVEYYLGRNRKAILYVNRKLMVEQASKVFTGFGIPHGIRSSGHKFEPWHPFQISSVQTEDARVLKKGEDAKWQLHEADLVLVDEAHIQKGEVVAELVARHLGMGAVVVGVTATPLGLAEMYDVLVHAGTNSELRKCGALVPAMHYGPDEPDLRGIKYTLGEDLTESQNIRAMMRPGLFGRVLDSFRNINPECRPTILFAPGVAESIWFAEEFQKAGINAAHIDGEDVWIKGELIRSSRSARQEVLNGSECGDIRIICNRFVLREGIDCPWLAHGILATVFGSLQSYLQSGGRLLRSHPSLRSITIQDHGGNWWRHGSLNADRIWNLGDTSQSLAAKRDDRLREYQQPEGASKEVEPSCCPVCKQIVTTRICPCGHDMTGHKRSRMVVQSNGTLKEMVGDIFTPKKTTTSTAAEKLWERMYYRAKNTGMTFRQAAALFAAENGWEYPSTNFRLMPMNTVDWYRRVSDVAPERLRRY